MQPSYFEKDREINRSPTRAAFNAKWPEAVARRGFVQIPKCLVTCLTDLGLKPGEAMVLFNLIEKCWYVGDVAYPKVDYIARNIGRSNSTVRNATKSLQEKGYITKTQRYNSSNLYDLTPAAKKLAAHMEHCRHDANYSAVEGQKSSVTDSQKAGDYIDSVSNINTDKETDSYSKELSEIIGKNGFRAAWDKHQADKKKKRGGSE